jgi:hypothetical protein
MIAFFGSSIFCGFLVWLLVGFSPIYAISSIGFISQCVAAITLTVCATVSLLIFVKAFLADTPPSAEKIDPRIIAGAAPFAAITLAAVLVVTSAFFGEHLIIPTVVTPLAIGFSLVLIIVGAGLIIPEKEVAQKDTLSLYTCLELPKFQEEVETPAPDNCTEFSADFAATLEYVKKMRRQRNDENSTLQDRPMTSEMEEQNAGNVPIDFERERRKRMNLVAVRVAAK